MTMISPEIYCESLEDKSFVELISERNRLIDEIKCFEEQKDKIFDKFEYKISPSPETLYAWNIEALGMLCKLMSKKINKIDYEEYSKIIHKKIRDHIKRND